MLTHVLFTRCNIVPIILHNSRVMDQCFRLPRVMGFVKAFPMDQLRGGTEAGGVKVCDATYLFTQKEKEVARATPHAACWTQRVR